MSLTPNDLDFLPLAKGFTNQLAQARIARPIAQNEVGSTSHFGFHGDGPFKKADLLWDDFLLVGSDEKSAKKFHQRWGLLKICACGKHINSCNHYRCRNEYFEDDDRFKPTFIEPYSRVCKLSTCFRALLKIKSELDQSVTEREFRQTVGSLQDWKDLDFTGDRVRHVKLGGVELTTDERYEFLRLPPRQRIQRAKMNIGYEMFNWLSRSQISFTFRWGMGSDDRPHVALADQAFGSVFPQLVMNLAIAMTAGKPIYFCSNCSDPYSPARRPKPNTFHVCEKLECLAVQNRRNVFRHRAGQTKKRPRQRVSPAGPEVQCAACVPLVCQLRKTRH